MTDTELSLLIKQRDEIDENINNIKNNIKNISSQAKELSDNRCIVDNIIEDEYRRRETEKQLDVVKELFKEKFEDYIRSPRKTKSIWIVLINGHRYSSSKGKFAWTSKKTAFNAVVDFILYHADYNSRKGINIDTVIEKLEEEGYIEFRELKF